MTDQVEQDGTENIALLDADSRVIILRTYYDTVSKRHSLAATTNTREHQAIHSGTLFSHNNSHSIANGASYDHLLITDSKDCHFRKVSVTATAAPIHAYVYEAPTTSANGSAASVINRNRQSVTANTALLYEGPTVSATGTEIDYLLLAVAGKEGGGSQESFAEELVLNNATEYLIRVTNNSGSTATVAINFNWYEEA